MKRKDKPKQPDVGTTASKLADLKAKQFMAQQKLVEAMKAQSAELDIAARPNGEDAIFKAFAQGGSQHLSPRPGSVMSAPRPSTLPPDEFNELAKRVLGYGSPLSTPEPPPPPKPVITKRDWPSLLRQVPDGMYHDARTATGDMAFTASMPSLRDFSFEDATGRHEPAVIALPLSDDELRRSDDAVGRLIDSAVTRVVTAEAIELLGGTTDKRTIEELLADVAGQHGLYPAVYFQSALDRVSDDTYALSYSVAWMYEEGLDDDEPEDELHLSASRIEWGSPSVSYGFTVTAVHCRTCSTEFGADRDYCPKCGDPNV